MAKYKVTLNQDGKQSKVTLEQDGQEIEMKGITKVTVVQDAGRPPKALLEVFGVELFADGVKVEGAKVLSKVQEVIESKFTNKKND